MLYTCSPHHSATATLPYHKPWQLSTSPLLSLLPPSVRDATAITQSAPESVLAAPHRSVAAPHRSAAAPHHPVPNQAACQFALMEKEERNRKKEKLKEDEERSSSGQI
jgi:hypothetical protein